MPSYSELAEIWTSRCRYESCAGFRKSGRVFFENDSFYSYGYHFTIAKHVNTASAGHVFLITSRRYSVSTASQVSKVRGALRRANAFIITVPSLDCGVAELEGEWGSELSDAVDRMAAARLFHTKQAHANTVCFLVNNLVRYYSVMGQAIPSSLTQYLGLKTQLVDHYGGV